MYEDASTYGALYDIRAPQPSIYYPTGSDDLHISLMFERKQDAHKYMNCLLEYKISPMSMLKEKLEVEKNVVAISSAQEGVFVHRDDYHAEDSDSPSNTWDDVKSPTEIPITYDPLQQMRSLENLSLMPPGDTLYKCYIAPQAYYEEYIKDKDNIILGSHLFHKYFDGDGKRRPAGSSLDWGTPPRFKIQFHEIGNSFLYQGTRYYQVFVKCEFQDPSMARAMEGRWREETRTIGDLTFLTFFYTSNIENCKKYLELKQRETEIRWGDDEEIIR